MFLLRFLYLAFSYYQAKVARLKAQNFIQRRKVISMFFKWRLMYIFFSFVIFLSAITQAQTLDVNIKDLFNAIKHEQYLQADVMFESGDIDINAIRASDRSTLLHLAIRQSEFVKSNITLRIVHYLVREKININARDSEGKTALYLAMQYNKFATAVFLIERGADVSIGELSGRSRTPLHMIMGINYPSGYTKKSLVQLLLNKGAKVNAKDISDKTPFHWAVLYDRVDIGDILIKSGANIDAQDSKGQTALHLAVQENRVHMGEMLIKEGADVDARDSTNKTALHLAMEHNVVGMIQPLLDKGARVDVKDSRGRTPLHYFATTDINTTKSLIIAGANIYAKDSEGATPIDLVQERGASVLKIFEKARVLYIVKNNKFEDFKRLVESGISLSARYFKRTLLNLTVDYDNIQMADFLLKKGVKVINSVRPGNSNGDNVTTLQLGVRNDNEEVVRLLLKNGARPNVTYQYGHRPILFKIPPFVSSSRNSETSYSRKRYAQPLQLAMEEGNESIAQLLLEHGADANVTNSKGETFVAWAIRRNSDKLVQILIDKEWIVVDTKQASGRRMFRLAVESDSDKVVQLFLNKGIDVATRNLFGNKSAVHLAIERGSEKVFNLFLAKGVDVHIRDSEGRTPLYWAIEYNRTDMAKRLLDKGANVHVRDSAGNTPLHWAAYNFNEEIARLLMEKGVHTEAIAKGKTALQLAEESNNENLIKLLNRNNQRRGGNRCEAAFQ